MSKLMALLHDQSTPTEIFANMHARKAEINKVAPIRYVGKGNYKINLAKCPPDVLQDLYLINLFDEYLLTPYLQMYSSDSQTRLAEKEALKAAVSAIDEDVARFGDYGNLGFLAIALTSRVMYGVNSKDYPVYVAINPSVRSPVEQKAA